MNAPTSETHRYSGDVAYASEEPRVNGLLQDWALNPEGELTERVRQDLDAVLSAWRGPVDAP
ncbi:hypothetical protein ACIQNG_20975 [Streptomyces sp. NPDC091377]|uniref:hypothetical protein n=1 Tax=Streptomyces sp. NPDC091377 TaxID=3365995 RepID=UPI003819C4E9